jgi:hypothetical protein
MTDVILVFTYYCPRCDDKTESGVSWAEAEKIVKAHVKKAHPDYDPNWFDTYPEKYSN